MAEELWQGYAPNGLPTSAITRQQARKGMLHGASHVWIWRQGKNGIELLLQRRAHDKATWPGFLDISAAGHIDAGETPLEAALRETAEEIGLILQPTDLMLLFSCRAYLLPDNSDIIEHEIRWVYAYRWQETELHFVDQEVESVEWLSLDEVQAILQGKSDQKLVPQGDAYFGMLFEVLRLITKLGD